MGVMLDPSNMATAPAAGDSIELGSPAPDADPGFFIGATGQTILDFDQKLVDGVKAAFRFFVGENDENGNEVSPNILERVARTTGSAIADVADQPLARVEGSLIALSVAAVVIGGTVYYVRRKLK